MTRRSVVSDRRRRNSSCRGKCAPVALVGLLLAFTPICAAQDLRLQPADAPSSGGAASALDTAEEQIPLPPALGAAQMSSPDADTEIPVPPTHSGPTISKDLTEALNQRGSLTLRNTTLHQALFMISDQWGINIVAGDVQGTVNGVFRNAPLREILDSILLSNGYNYRTVGESLVVSSVKDLGQINPFFQSATIPVHSANIDEVVEGARLLTTPGGQVTPIKSARAIVVLDFPDRVKMIRNFVTSLEGSAGGVGGITGPGQPMEVGYFRTQHIAVKAAEEALQAVLSKEGRVAIMEKEDKLIVSDYPANLAMVESVLERIDQPRPQVRITALIYDISMQDIEELGINWREIVYTSGNTDLAVGIDPISRTPLPGSGAAGGATVAFGALLPHFDINSVANALRNANDARLLANPSVAVLENEEAIFQSVAEIPYQQLTQTSAGGDIGTTAFKEAGITLRVIPKIAADGTIRMVVSPEFSRLAGFTPGDNQPIIDKRVATTTLAVNNRQTIAIGGLRERRDVGDFRGIPFLMDVRYVGNLFRYRKTDVRESELVLFISPEVVTTCDPVVCRDAKIIETVGGRLNQIPEAEGYPPCCPPANYRQPRHFPLAGPVRLPPVEIAAKPEEATTPQAVAAANLAASDTAAKIDMEPNDLFGAPSIEAEILPPELRESRIGGFLEVGGRSGTSHR